MDKRRIAVISAGLSTPSSTRMLADRLADATAARLAQSGVEPVIDVIELREYAQDVTNNLLTGFASPKLQDAIDAVLGADGIIAVTPVFTASYSGLFKSFFDVLDNQSLADMPVLMGATAGTARHSMVLDHAMRPLFSYLRMTIVPTGVFAASTDWGGVADEAANLHNRIERAATQFVPLVLASRRARDADDPFTLDPAFSPTGASRAD